MKTKKLNNKMTRIATALMLALGLVLSGAGLARAEGRHDRDRKDRWEQRHDSRWEGHRQQRREMAVRKLPRGARHIRMGQHEYYVHRGHFYRRDPRGFLSVSTPVGALVASLPGGFLSVSIGGVNYWQGDGVYFRRAARGFVVVPPPVVPSVTTIDLPPAPVEAGGVAVEVPLLNVRSGPGLRFPVVGVVNQGQVLDIRGDAPGWYYVQGPDGSFGWVVDNLTRPLPQG